MRLGEETKEEKEEETTGPYSIGQPKERNHSCKI